MSSVFVRPRFALVIKFLRNTLLSTLLLSSIGFSGSSLANPTACFDTSVGSVCIELFEDIAPVTVANFIEYATSGDYDGSIIHRSVPGFIVQGGGFSISSDLVLLDVPSRPAIINEFQVANTRGTVAMAKLGGDPNSATNQWFVNLADNSSNLDNQNGGFTVFGRVIDDGMEVFDTIAALPRVNFGGALTDTPTIGFNGVTNVNNFVYVSNMQITAEQVEDVVPEASSSFEDGFLSISLDAGDAGLLQLSLELISTDPSVIFEFRNATEITPSDSTEGFATFSAQDGLLTLPRLKIDESTTLNNVVLELTDAEALQFTFISVD